MASFRGGSPLKSELAPVLRRAGFVYNEAGTHMCERSGIAIATRVGAAAAALFLLTVLSASPSFAQISEDAARQCAALTNSVRRVTCYDLLVKLRVTDQVETTAQGDGVTVRLESEEVSKLDAWIDAQPEPKPNRREAVRRLLDMATLALGGLSRSPPASGSWLPDRERYQSRNCCSPTR